MWPIGLMLWNSIRAAGNLMPKRRAERSNGGADQLNRRIYNQEKCSSPQQNLQSDDEDSFDLHTLSFVVQKLVLRMTITWG